MRLRPSASLAFALLVMFPLYVQAETDEVPPLPQRNPARLGEPIAKAPVLPGDEPTVPWTDREIADAKAECAKALSGVALDYQPLPPIKEGICGAPAPILVRSIGSDPKVAIDPPATMTCSLARGLSLWLSKTVQPDAEALLSTQVVKLRNASSYVCRNRYGGAATPLSEHALANALDVSDFVFASGEHITVLDSWPRVAEVPTPSTPSAAHVAAATSSVTPVSNMATAHGDKLMVTRISTNPFVRSATAATVTVLRPPAVKAKEPPVAPTSPPSSSGSNTTEIAKVRANPFVSPDASAEATSGDAAAADTAAPSESDSDAGPQPPTLSERESKFVKAVHDDACHTFGTVLGPEANEAHKNHFHLDMKARRHTAFCQ
jgi:hypothetical protein